jgi:hypothetical protein
MTISENCIKNWPEVLRVLSLNLDTYVQTFTNNDYVHIDQVSLLAIEHLMINKFIDPQATQNDSPSVQKFFDFARNYPLEMITFHGYLIGPKRDDCRISIEGLLMGGPLLESKAREEFILFCRKADELEVSADTLRSWWD